MSLLIALPTLIANMKALYRIPGNSPEIQAMNARSDVQAEAAAQEIYNFVKQAQVDPGIPLQAGPNSGATTGPGTIS